MSILWCHNLSLERKSQTHTFVFEYRSKLLKIVVIIYTDDTTLLTTANEFNINIELSISINKELAKVNEWLQANKL